MSQANSTVVPDTEKGKGGPPTGGRVATGGRDGGSGGAFKQYKPEQGKWTRLGTFLGLLLLIAWGSYFLYDRLQVYADGPEAWRLLVSTGIPAAVLVLLGAVAWWLSYSSRKSSDFMIATEGEMKKVSWSTRREIIGSTKVVILFTVLLATTLFVVDLGLTSLFRWIGVLKG